MNLKTDVSRKQSVPSFSKNEHLLPPDMQVEFGAFDMLQKELELEQYAFKEYFKVIKT